MGEAYPTEGQPPPEAYAFHGEGQAGDGGMEYPSEGQMPPDAYAFHGGEGGGGGMEYPQGQAPPDAYAFQGEGGQGAGGGEMAYHGEAAGEGQQPYAYPAASYGSYHPAGEQSVESMYKRKPTPVASPKESFIQSYRSLAYLDSDPFMRYARHGADTCSLDFTDKAKIDARDFLHRTECDGGATLWDHIRDTLERMLLERPRAPALTLQDLSRRTRDARLHPNKKFPLDKEASPQQNMHAHELMNLAGKPAPEDAQWPGGGPDPDWEADAVGDDDEEEGGGEAGEDDAGPRAKPPRWQDLPRLNRLLQQAGLGLPTDEAFVVGMAMRQLCHDEDVLKARFWGKIFGTHNNYYVIEVDLSGAGLAKREEAARHGEEEGEGEGEGDETRVDPESSAGEALRGPAEQQKADEVEGEGGPGAEPLPPFWTKPPPPFPPLPEPTIKPDVVVPSEAAGTGVNKKVYYVTSEPMTGSWRVLPDVTPAQLQAARQIRRYLTGKLHAPIRSTPAFPGDEQVLLRAQIARITAATQVSPQGFYAGAEERGEGLEEEEEEDELEGEGGEGGGRGGGPQENPRYRPVPMADLLDPSGAAWVHHTENILRQGRTKWWNPSSPPPAEGGEEEEEEKEEAEEEEVAFDPNAPEPEVGPALLTPLSEDSSVEATPTWTFRPGCSLMPALWGSVVARSNLWPGAWAYAMGKVVLCVYVGWGVKAVAHSFTPALPGPPQREYPTGPEIMEQTDPTPEEEEEWRLAHQPPPPPQFGEEGLFEEEEDLAGPND